MSDTTKLEVKVTNTTPSTADGILYTSVSIEKPGADEQPPELTITVSEDNPGK